MMWVTGYKLQVTYYRSLSVVEGRVAGYGLQEL
jgi:hypothetical protein